MLINSITREILAIILSDGAKFNNKKRQDLKPDTRNIGFYADVFINEDDFQVYDVCIGVTDTPNSDRAEISGGCNGVFLCGVDHARFARLFTDFSAASGLFRRCWVFVLLRRQLRQSAWEVFAQKQPGESVSPPPDW